MGKVLVVEDEFLIQMNIEECLRLEKYDVATASNCADALALVRNDPDGFRAAVLDVGLPDGRGDRLGDQLREMVPNIPIVLCTGYGVGEIRCEAFAYGRIVMIAKPFLPDALCEALRVVEAQPPWLETRDCA